MNSELNAARKDGLFMNEKMIDLASRIVLRIRKFEMTNPDFDNPKTDKKIDQIVKDIYSSVPNPKLTTLKYLYLYILDVDHDEWQGESNNSNDMAKDLVQGILESGIAVERYDYFQRKMKSDLVLIKYLKGGNLSESTLQSVLSNGILGDSLTLTNQAREYANHNLRYDTIRTRDAHLKKVRTLQGALENKRLHGVIVENPNKSRSLGVANRVRRALRF
jgi:hypothetical protein